MNSVLSRMMVIPRPIWIFAIILGFYVWWPFGLAILATACPCAEPSAPAAAASGSFRT